MALENLPLFNAMNREEVKPPFPHPHRPLTSQESHFVIMEKVNACIHEVNLFEQRVKHEIDNFMDKSEQENTAFKEAIQASYNAFQEVVQREINNFELDMQNNFDLYRNDLDKRVADFQTAINNEFTTLQTNVIKACDDKLAEITADFLATKKDVVDTLNTTKTDVVNASNAKIEEMEQLKISLNQMFMNFTAEVQGIVNSYKTAVNNHMATQDGKIEEYKQYMVDNLPSNVLKIFNQKAQNGEISQIMSEVYGESRVFKGSLSYDEIMAINNAKNGDYYYCTTDNHYYQKTEDAFVDIGTGDKILDDFVNYKIYNEKYNKAVSNEKNPFKKLAFNNHYYFCGGQNYYENEISETPIYDILKLENYKNKEEKEPFTLYGTITSLEEPIPIFENSENEYALLIHTDLSCTLEVGFSSIIGWGANATINCMTINLKKGFNLVPFKTNTFNVEDEKTHFKYFYMKGHNFYKNKIFEAYLIDNTMTGCLNDKVNNIYEMLGLKKIDPNSIVIHKNNVSANIEIVNDTTIKTVVKGKTTTEPEWRFLIVGINLGKDIKNRRLLVRNNTNLPQMKSVKFYIHKNYYSWGVPISCNYGECAIINLEEIINENNEWFKNHEGNFYLLFGVEISIEIATHEDFECSFEVVELVDSMCTNKILVETEKIICWGDSLTAGGGWTETLSKLSNKTVINCGVGGENTNTIMSRQGSDCITINNIVIPASKSPIKLSNYNDGFNTLMGNKSTPILQGGTEQFNPCIINGVKGELLWSGASYDDVNGIWTFTRSNEGEEVIINRPTELITYADRIYNGKNIHIFFTGTNDGVFDIDEFISKIDRMIAHCRTSHYLILGLTRKLDDFDIINYKKKMYDRYGRNFLDLHGYLYEYGLEDAGIIATERDLNDIENGKIPTSLTSDGVHYTTATKTIIGNLVYKRLRDLNFV